MYISLNTLILIVVLIVSIMTVPYSIVITVLFIHGKFEYKILCDEYHELEETAEGVLKKVRGEDEESKKKKAKRGPVGFAVTNESDKSAEKAEPDGKEVAQA